MGRLDIDYIGRLRSSQGWEAYLKVRQPIENDIDIWWQPEINDKTRIWKGVLSYIYKLDERAWALERSAGLMKITSEAISGADISWRILPSG